MTAVEAWIKIEKKLVALGWKLDTEHGSWSNKAWIVDFSELPNLRIVQIGGNSDESNSTISAKEFKLIADWIDGYWILEGQLKKK